MIVHEFAADHASALAAFNARLLAGGLPFAFGGDEGPVVRRRRNLVLLDHAGEIRGAYGLRKDAFVFRGEPLCLDYYAAPVSEGVVDRRFAAAGAAILLDAMRRAPLLYGLGGGALDERSPRLLLRAGWRAHEVPTWFRVENAARVARLLPSLRSPGRDSIARLAALTGAATGMAAVASAWQRLRHASVGPHDAVATPVADLDHVADAIWEASAVDYALIGVRDADHMRELFPQASRKLRRLVISRGPETLGWAVIACPVEKWSRHFGALTVAAIVDILAPVCHAGAVAAATAAWLKRLDADVIVTNQNHHAWQRAFQAAGFLRGASKYHFLASKALVRRLDPFAEIVAAAHFTRGDGDGAVSLA